jgi:predicted nuclease of predicted toxin-antitoxin system
VTHVFEIGLDEATDQQLWSRALAEGRVVVSKDEDFLFLANRVGDLGRFLWVRLGNSQKTALLRAFESCLAEILDAFEAGQQVVELG